MTRKDIDELGWHERIMLLIELNRKLSCMDLEVEEARKLRVDIDFVKSRISFSDCEFELKRICSEISGGNYDEKSLQELVSRFHLVVGLVDIVYNQNINNHKIFYICYAKPICELIDKISKLLKEKKRDPQRSIGIL